MGALDFLWGEKQEQPTRPEYIVGLDLGKSQDYTAIALLETRVVAPDFIAGPEAVYHCKWLQRFKLGTSYPHIVASVREMCRREPLLTFTPRLGIDQTGVGAAVADMFKQAEINADLQPILIHGGDRATNEDGVWRVPKRELVGVTQVALQTGRLKIPPILPEAGVLKRELQNFQVSISDAGHDSYEARVGKHDDLVLALAMALWLAARPEGRLEPLDPELVEALTSYTGK
ncbi:MAG: hypothetical protein ACR2HX_22365 [Pyrinomonadaceae bacterium]